MPQASIVLWWTLLINTNFKFVDLYGLHVILYCTSQWDALCSLLSNHTKTNKHSTYPVVSNFVNFVQILSQNIIRTVVPWVRMFIVHDYVLFLQYQVFLPLDKVNIDSLWSNCSCTSVVPFPLAVLNSLGIFWFC